MPQSDKMRAYQRARKARWRAAAVAYLGGACAVCGETDPRVLEIDHVNGGGNEERRRRNSVDTWRHIAQGMRKGQFRLLCANDHARITYAARLQA